MIMAIPPLALTACVFNFDCWKSQNKKNQHVQNPNASDSHMLQCPAYCSCETVYASFMYHRPPHLWSIQVLALIHAVCLLSDLEAFTRNDYYINSSTAMKIASQIPQIGLWFTASSRVSWHPSKSLNPTTSRSARNLGITVSYLLVFTPCFIMVMSWSCRFALCNNRNFRAYNLVRHLSSTYHKRHKLFG